jgi:hypothetical protein
MTKSAKTKLTKLTPLREKTLLDVLRIGGSISKAAEAAGLAIRSIRRWKSQNAAFAERFNEALETGCDRLEDEAVKRAISGVERPVYQGGKLVGTELIYSDRLLELLLKSRRPHIFREPRGGADATASVHVNFELSTARDTVLGRLREISERQAAKAEKSIGEELGEQIDRLVALRGKASEAEADNGQPDGAAVLKLLPKPQE